MTVRRGFACSAAKLAVTSSYQAIAVLGSQALDARAKTIPDECLLSMLTGEIDAIASSAATISWYLALDAAGDNAITNVVASTIVVGLGTATDGGFAVALDFEYTRPTTASQGSLYLVAKTNTGTCNLTPRLYWREDL